MKTKSPGPVVLNAYTPSLEERSVEEHNVTSLYCQDKYDKFFSMQEVAGHCEPDSLWIVVDNIVYDVTQFSFEHPGGSEILLEHAGRDCTVAFHEKGHSLAAMQMLQKYKIGMLNEEDRIVM